MKLIDIEKILYLLPLLIAAALVWAVFGGR